MKEARKKYTCLWLLFAMFIATMGAGVNANPAMLDQAVVAVADGTEEMKTGDGPVVVEPKFIVLPDKLNSGMDSLTNTSPVHYYGFVSERGQDVLLHSPGGDPASKAWRVEYYENKEWVVQRTATKVFSNLSPGASVIVRITAGHQVIPNEIAYSLVLGSYPVLKSFDLFDEPGVIRIPSGYTEPNWLATQVYREALLEVRFTDTKGVALEGGVANFGLTFGPDEKNMKGAFISDANGVISKRIEFGRCHGGQQAKDFVHRQMGFNTWRSYYQVARYFVTNSYLSPSPEMSDWFYLGHICDQTVLKTVAPKN
nr:hypothetical protein [Pseudomonas viridiflava]